MSPYQPPVSAPSHQGVPSVHRSVIPKVFGILHIIFGASGLIWSLISMVIYAVNGGKALQFGQQDEATSAIQNASNPTVYDFASQGGAMVLAILLIVAGIGLVRYKRSGLKVSNAYTLLAILHKIGVVAIMFLVTFPNMKAALEEVESSDNNIVVTQSMETIVIVSGIATVAIMLIYPVLSFFLLNKKQSKESLS